MPFPVEPLNIYFAEHPVPLLIDTPPRGAAFMALLEEKLAGLGYSVSQIERIIITHPHFDHYGLAEDIAKRSGAEIWVRAGTQVWFEDYEQNLREEEQFHREILLKAGAPYEWILQVNRRLFGWLNEYGCRLTPTRYLNEGETIELFSTFTTVGVPGHTPWCMLIYEPNDKIAFTGDFLLGAISSNPLIYRPSLVPEGYKSLKSYILSLRKVSEMELKTAFPGHGAVIEDPSKRISSLLGFISERKALVLSILQEGTKTPFEMVLKMFPDLVRDELFLAISEVIGYLELLEEEGSAVRTEGTRLCFSPV